MAIHKACQIFQIAPRRNAQVSDPLPLFSTSHFKSSKWVGSHIEDSMSHSQGWGLKILQHGRHDYVEWGQVAGTRQPSCSLRSGWGGVVMGWHWSVQLLAGWVIVQPPKQCRMSLCSFLYPWPSPEHSRSQICLIVRRLLIFGVDFCCFLTPLS